MYYVEVGGGSGYNQGATAARGLGTRSISIVPRGSDDEDTRYQLRSEDITDVAGRVTLGESFTGEIESAGDRHRIAVDLTAGHVYWLKLEGPSLGGRTLGDPQVHGVEDPGGELIVGTTNGPDGVPHYSRVSFKATMTGTHHVVVGDRNDGAGAYKLSITEISDEFATTTAAAPVVEAGESVSGSIERVGEVDWIAAALVAGQGYRIDLIGQILPIGSSDPYLHGVYDADGNWFSNSWDDSLGYGWDSLATFTPTESGTYYFAVGYDRNTVGTYTLSLTTFTDDFPATTGTTGTVSVGGSAMGSIDEQLDADWFAVELIDGRTYRFGVQGGPNVYAIYDGSGFDVANVGVLQRTSQLTFTATETDTYYVGVRNDSKYEYFFNEPMYTLSVEEIIDGM